MFLKNLNSVACKKSLWQIFNSCEYYINSFKEEIDFNINYLKSFFIVKGHLIVKRTFITVKGTCIIVKGTLSLM